MLILSCKISFWLPNLDLDIKALVLITLRLFAPETCFQLEYTKMEKQTKIVIIAGMTKCRDATISVSSAVARKIGSENDLEVLLSLVWIMTGLNVLTFKYL